MNTELEQIALNFINVAQKENKDDIIKIGPDIIKLAKGYLELLDRNRKLEEDSWILNDLRNS